MTNPKARFNPADAHTAWETSMAQQIERLHASLLQIEPQALAGRAGATWNGAEIRFNFWGRPLAVPWPALAPAWLDSGSPCSISDSALLLYYLLTANGAAPAGKWASFRELPDGAFYHQAFQGYSGDLLARRFDPQPQGFCQAAQALGGRPLVEISPFAYAFQPLPRLALAAVYWPGDEEFPGRAAILFDAAARNYLPIDGCALLGSALARRLIKTVV